MSATHLAWGRPFLSERESGAARTIGRGLVAFMPKLLAGLSTIGIVAMLWVGGHIELVGLDELGWHAPYDLVHHLEEIVHDAVPSLGGALPWIVNTTASALLGVLVGAIVVAASHLVPRRRAR